MKISGRARILGVAVAAASMGVGIGVIADAGARSGAGAAHDGHGGFRPGFRHGLRGAVEGTIVVPYDGGYKTITFNRGTVLSTDGSANTITIDEKAPGASTSYDASKTLDVSGATVINNGQSAGLGSLTQGERVSVIHGPRRTLVIAHTPGAGGWGAGQGPRG